MATREGGHAVVLFFIKVFSPLIYHHVFSSIHLTDDQARLTYKRNKIINPVD